MPGDLAELDGRPVDQHHDDVRVGRGHGPQGRELVGGQAHVGAVETLRLVGPGQPDQHHHGLGVGRDPHGFRAQRGVAVPPVGCGVPVTGCDAVAGGERDLGEGCGERVEGGVDAGRVDL